MLLERKTNQMKGITMKSKTNAYQYITEHDALNFAEGRQGEKIKYIVIHHWGKMGQRFDNVIDWFCANQTCETSAHYVVEAGKVACIVDPANTAWHAGNWAYNAQSIGIECRPEATDGDYDTTAQLIAELWRTYGKLPLLGHRDVPGVQTACPGGWDLKRLKNLANKYYNGVKVMNKKSEQVSDWAKEPWDRATKNKIVDGKNPKRPATREEVVVICDRFFKLMNRES